MNTCLWLQFLFLAPSARAWIQSAVTKPSPANTFQHVIIPRLAFKISFYSFCTDCSCFSWLPALAFQASLTGIY